MNFFARRYNKYTGEQGEEVQANLDAVNDYIDVMAKL